MSEKLAKWVKLSGATKPEKPGKVSPPPEEEAALRKLQKEAAAAGATLHSDGEGGLSSSLVLGVMRRDGYTCKVCGGNQDLSVHHKGGVVASKWLSKKGHENTPQNLVTICEPCHDNVHEKAREEGTDSSQVKPEGDKE